MHFGPSSGFGNEDCGRCRTAWPIVPPTLADPLRHRARGRKIATMISRSALLRATLLTPWICTFWTQGVVALQSSAEDTTLVARIRAAEDARATTPEALAPIMRGLDSRDPEVQQMAVRALGRLERPDLVPVITPLLSASSSGVRAEAANALGQAVFNGEALLASEPLITRLDVETDPAVRAMIFQTVGRLPYTNATQVRIAENALIRTLGDTTRVTSPAALGIARGLESLMRRNASTYRPSRTTIRRLRQLAIFGRPPPPPPPQDTTTDERRMVFRRAPLPGSENIRRVATAALIPAGGLDGDFLSLALTDTDVEVRRIAMSAARAIDDLPVGTRARIVAQGLRDESSAVRYEAVRAYGSRHQAEFGCEPIREAALDDNIHVALLAIDLLGNGCATGEDVEPFLAGLTAELPSPAPAPTPAPDSADVGAWHKPSHALVALTRVAPERVELILTQFTTLPIWQVRMYAVRAAERLSLASRLRSLAYDEHHNVREAAVAALQRLDVQGADSIYLAALESSDYQLIRTAARALSERYDASVAVPALLATLRRITNQQRETSRDARMAVIEKLLLFQDDVPEDSLRLYLRDFDPLLAGRIAEALTERSGSPISADPAVLPRVPVPMPTAVEIQRLGGARVFLYIKERRRIELRLFPSDAPTNVDRFVRLARAGYFDRLTFHRVAPNFVIQGGSPGANEYAGDGPYTRDELTARMHRRGTVGISTRGRDTGDAQIFINLVDNMRLDHNYTIIGEVVRGMDVVDAVIEGSVIARVEVRER